MPWDLQIDPVTHDFLDDGAGGFAVTHDADTAVQRALLEIRGAWWGDPDAGADGLEPGGRLWQLGDGPSAELHVRDACRRALQRLITDGRIADLDIHITRDAVGRLTVETRFRNLRTGLPSLVAVHPLER